MKKSLKSQLVAAVVMVVIAAVALTSASYAWFTSIANPEVKSIDLYVKAADNLMLSAYDNATTPNINLSADWKATVAQTDISDTTPTGSWGTQTTAFPTNMLNVSSLFNATNSGFYQANFSALGVKTGYSAVTQSGNYAKFSLWAKSTQDGYLYLDGTDTIGSTVTGLTVTEPGNSISKTVRVAIVPVTASVEDWAKSVIWEPNSKAHLAAIYGGTGAVVKSATAAVSGLLLANTATQDTYDFQDADTNIVSADKTTAFGVKPATGNNDATKIALLNVVKDTPTNFNVYIWVEGADADTLNAVAKNSFETYLRFGLEKGLSITY